MKSIEDIKAKGLCIGCGICTAICPVKCIELKRIDYDLVPVINATKCINCGLCYNVCKTNDIKRGIDIEKYILAHPSKVLSAQTKNEDILLHSQSGGVITTIIQYLLSRKIYESAFLVEECYFDMDRLIAKRYNTTSDLIKTCGSKYVLVSYEECAQYMLSHTKERIIIVAQGCITTKLQNMIKMKNLFRENYLFLGLFCDKTMNYGVLDYFQHHKSNKVNPKGLVFRSKEWRGWPGDVKIIDGNDSVHFLSKTERMRVKDYFMPSACIYCLDKLNRNSDLSCGDNYSSDNFDNKGVSSVVIRTSSGEIIWSYVSELFKYHEQSIDSLVESQCLVDKKLNFEFAIIKGIYSRHLYPKHISIKAYVLYSMALLRLNITRCRNKYTIYRRLSNYLFLKENAIRIVTFPSRTIKRMFKSGEETV